MKERIRDILSQRKRESITFSAGLSPAAVILPLYQKEGEYHILFTKRTEKVEHHKRQISFPGGAPHEDDRSLEDTALRETFEEIGVRAEDVEILGELDKTATLTSNFLITPFVAVIPYPYEFAINRDEIEELVKVPLSALLEHSGKRTYHYKGKVIWGATAMILRQFLNLVSAEDKSRGGWT